MNALLICLPCASTPLPCVPDVIVSDDADREDEADLILAAEATEMARMIRDGSNA